MKVLSKTLLATGLLALALSAFSGCNFNTKKDPAKNDPVKNDSPEPQALPGIPEDFTQTTIAASTNLYPQKAEKKEEVENPLLVDSTQTLDDSLAAGSPVKSSDNIITVTPRYDGLLIHVDYNATEESKWWKHNTLKIQNVTDKDSKRPVEVGELQITNSEDALESEIFYKFTEKGNKYKIWIAHMGAPDNEEGEPQPWADWGETSESPAQVTAIGGYGNIDFSAKGMSFSENNETIILENLVLTQPSIVTISPKIEIRAEEGSRWGGGANKEVDGFELNKEVITIKNSEINTFVNGKKQLFMIINYYFEMEDNGKKLNYQQTVYANEDKWVSDYVEPPAVPEHQFPLIKIVSTENEGDNGFIKEPIAHHVKDSAMAWEDPAWLLSIPDPYYEVCTIAVDDGTAQPGQVKVRGNWTTSYAKKSLRIKFDEKQNLCGLNKGKTFKNWVLLALYKDASMLRDAVALKMFKALFGNTYYASDCCLVEVEVNGEYLGVYLLAEQQETKKNRINITEADKNYTGTDIGYLIEFDSYYTSEIENERFEINYGAKLKDYAGREINVADIQKGYTIKSDVYSAAQKEFIMKYMNRLWKICYDAVYNKLYFRFKADYTLEQYTPEGATDDEKCKNCISAVIDLESLADMYIYNELVCDPDLYLTSFFMDIDFAQGKDHKLRFEAPWDFDSTMGNKSFAIEDISNERPEKKNMSTISEVFAGAAQTDVNCEHERIHVNPWMLVFVKQAWFQKLVKDQWAAINTATVLSGLQTFMNDNSAAKYQPVFDYNRYLWGDPSYNSELCEASRTAAKTSQAASAEYLKTWLTNRFAAVDTIIKGLK